MKYPHNYCVIDIETTGLSRYRDTIIEIGCIKVREHRVISEFSVLVHPHRNIPPFITSLTGITNEMILSSAIELDEALIALYDFIEEDALVGHNICFDMGFICHKSNELLGLAFNNPQLDTMKIARRTIQCANYKLSTLCSYYNIQNTHAHRALSDVYATYEIFEKLVN